jgi:predicted nucleic acid-binding protein
MPSDSTALLLPDSNVLVYAADALQGDKSRRASEVLERLAPTMRGRVTSQLLVEFYAVSVRPRRERPPILEPASAAMWVHHWQSVLSFMPIGENIVQEAMRGAATYQMHIYDALVWASAKFAQAIVLTEDMQSRETIEGVRYINPFADDFAFDHIGL